MVFGVDDGATKEMYPDETNPKASNKYDTGVNLLILLKIINAEDIINPKNRTLVKVEFRLFMQVLIIKYSNKTNKQIKIK